MIKNRFRFYLIVVFVLVLTLGGMICAHTYTTSSETIGIAEPTGDIATVNATATQPDWDDVLIPVPDTIIYRPDAAGDNTEIANQFPDSGAHWDKVDEDTANGDSTYIATDDNKWEKDLYKIPDHSTQTAAGLIFYNKLYMVVRSEGTPTQDSARAFIKTEGKEKRGDDETVTANYTSYSYQWNTNPETTDNWTWAQIDALQIGVQLRDAANLIPTRCTQVYTEVSFEAPPLSGNTPTDALFIVTPNANYTGDLGVRVYLTNTGNLTKAYSHLNMQLYLEGSLEAGKTPNYQVLTLENGVASFGLGVGGSDDYTLSVTGGDYTLKSREPSEWEAGYTVTPELYCEVTQR